MANTKRTVFVWTQEALDKLVRLYLEGVPLEELAERIGASYPSTKAKITMLRKSGMDLPYRDQKLIQSTRRKTMNLGEKKLTAFDREYQGAVPFGHWSITKPWRKNETHT